MPEDDAEVHSYHQECRKSPGVKVRCVNVTVDITNTNTIYWHAPMDLNKRLFQ